MSQATELNSNQECNFVYSEILILKIHLIQVYKIKFPCQALDHADGMKDGKTEIGISTGRM